VRLASQYPLVQQARFSAKWITSGLPVNRDAIAITSYKPTSGYRSLRSPQLFSDARPFGRSESVQRSLDGEVRDVASCVQIRYALIVISILSV
jgi:hypothetical protein